MKSYDATMNDYQESIALGYSARETIEALAFEEEVNEVALKELQHALLYGI